MLAQTLNRVGLAACVPVAAIDGQGILSKGMVAIYATSEGDSVLNRITDTPGVYCVLERAYNGDLVPDDPLFETCRLNRRARRRIMAFNLQRSARASWRLGLGEEAKESRLVARRVLGKLPPLRSTDIRGIIRQLVIRAQMSQLPRPHKPKVQ